MSISFIVSGDKTDFDLVLHFDGKVLTVPNKHHNFSKIKSALKMGNKEDIVRLYNEPAPVTKQDAKAPVRLATSGTLEAKGHKAEVKDGVVLIDGEPCHETVATMVKRFIADSLPFEYLLRFLERVENNPSYTSKGELFNFLQHRGLPITPDGYFLAYKAIRSDWMDKYSGTISNHIGAKPSIPRNKVDDNRAKGCSAGLHVGALDYVGSYGGHGDRLVVCKVDPADVVSVPDCSSCQKCRVTTYEVLSEFTGELRDALYDEQAKPVYDEREVEEDDEGWDWDDCDDECDCDDDCDDTDCEDEDEDEVEAEDDSCDNCGYHNKRDRFGRFTR